MIDPQRLLDWQFPDITRHYTADDSMLYALAIGIGADPLDPRQLAYVDDTSSPQAFPTMAVVLGFPGSWMADPETGIDFARIVHGEEEIIIHRPFAAAGTVIARHRVIDVIDKGAGRGAVIVYDKDLFDADDGAHLATVRHTTFARGDGGFSGAPAVPRERLPAPVAPERAPDCVREAATLPQQALIYRLCADRNPLHSNPATARAAGFDRPILHGLCSFGMAGHAVVAAWADGDAARLVSLRARFSAPVFPGDTLQFEMFDAGADAVAFRARAKERGALVLSHGHATLTSA